MGNYKIYPTKLKGEVKIPPSKSENIKMGYKNPE